jgi:hypothetical protein
MDSDDGGGQKSIVAGALTGYIDIARGLNLWIAMDLATRRHVALLCVVTKL